MGDIGSIYNSVTKVRAPSPGDTLPHEGKIMNSRQPETMSKPAWGSTDVARPRPSMGGRPHAWSNPDDALLNARGSAAKVGSGLAAFWRAIAAGRLPRPFYPLPRAPRWRRSE